MAFNGDHNRWSDFVGVLSEGYIKRSLCVCKREEKSTKIYQKE